MAYRTVYTYTLTQSELLLYLVILDHGIASILNQHDLPGTSTSVLNKL